MGGSSEWKSDTLRRSEVGPVDESGVREDSVKLEARRGNTRASFNLSVPIPKHIAHFAGAARHRVLAPLDPVIPIFRRLSVHEEGALNPDEGAARHDAVRDAGFPV
jgi:hypothetical protein